MIFRSPGSSVVKLGETLSNKSKGCFPLTRFSPYVRVRREKLNLSKFYITTKYLNEYTLNDTEN